MYYIIVEEVTGWTVFNRVKTFEEATKEARKAAMWFNAETGDNPAGHIVIATETMTLAGFDVAEKWTKRR